MMSEATMNENEAEDVEYIESKKLDDIEDVEKSLKLLLADLETEDWVLLCETLNNVRRFSIYHKERLRDILENVISLLVKSLKNPRSAVCKTTIMTCSDIFKAFGDEIINSLDPLLVQLLLKSSQDKSFVCEVAENALITLTIWVSPILLLPKLQHYFENYNPCIRAKASICFSRCVSRLGAEGIKEYGIDKLVKIASSQLSDQLPESREAAYTLLFELQTAYEKFPVLAPEQDEKMPVLSPEQDEKIPVLPLEQEESSKEPQVLSWEQFCESKLPELSAQAVLRVTNIPREDLASEGRKRRLSPLPSSGKRTKINDGLSPSASLPPPEEERDVTTPEHPPPPEGSPREIQARKDFREQIEEVNLINGLHYYCTQSKRRPFSPLKEDDFKDLHNDCFPNLYPTIEDLKQKVLEMEMKFWDQEAIVDKTGLEDLLETLDLNDERIYRQSKRIWGGGD